MSANLSMGSRVNMQVIRAPEILIPRLPLELRQRWTPKSNLGRLVAQAHEYLPSDLAAELIEACCSSLVGESTLRVKLRRWNDKVGEFQWEDHGVQSRWVITTAGVNFLVQALIGAQSSNLWKYHAIGTGNTAEAIGDTALVAELTADYTPSNTRATGTQVVGASNNIYKTVATNTISAGGPLVIAEFGLFTTSATGTGTLWDRKLVGPYTLNTSDSLQSELDTTLASGG